MRIFLLVFVSISILACSQQPAEVEEQWALQAPKTNYSIGSCSPSPFYGSAVRDFSISTPMQSSGYFDKMIQLNRFYALLPSNSFSIVETLQSEGVHFYKINSGFDSSCQYFDFLFDASGETLLRWLKAEGQSGSLLGMFTASFRRFDNGQVQLLRPEIVLRGDMQKWTLIHEATHYLFAQGRTREKQWSYLSELSNRLNSLESEIITARSTFFKSPSISSSNHLIGLYKNFFTTSLQLYKRGPLEEFAIEAMLLRESEAGFLTDINKDFNTRNAYFYMASNADRVTPNYRDLISSLQDLEMRAFAAAEKEKQRLINRTWDLLEFIYEELDYAESLNFSSPWDRSLHAHDSPNCGHSDHQVFKEMDRLFDKI